MSNKKKIIIAGNWTEFRNYLVENGLTESDAIYADEQGHNIRGITAFEVIEYGTYYMRNDYPRIKIEALNRVRKNI